MSSSDFEGALCNLEEVFTTIRQAGLRLNLKKWQLFWRETAFLGHVDFATIASPLHHLTDRGQPYVWDDPCSQAFNILQTALITAPVLAYPDMYRPFILDTDASNVGVGAVLSQQSNSGDVIN
ncbi:hypothetical protein AAFF_G00262380 [Aldrovandia affinis]|uniref:Reverse transcriptase/retrotransposon-derived protein RNase H-like domain-containing protein n=1 Tax=Aldrovandia affinis TaxID=143900 RepID=A0AAD7SSX9_9TELE|nr:hypothetical protein AAFF_G00262380 [Aldrovandia affinis]